MNVWLVHAWHPTWQKLDSHANFAVMRPIMRPTGRRQYTEPDSLGAKINK